MYPIYPVVRQDSFAFIFIKKIGVILYSQRRKIRKNQMWCNSLWGNKHMSVVVYLDTHRVMYHYESISKAVIIRYSLPLLPHSHTVYAHLLFLETWTCF
jgi:hypothetical protein